MNNRLLSAMKAAHVTIDDIAELTDVDRRTVQRWLQGRIPHPNHRWTIVEHLKIREELLWPSDISNENADINCSAEMIALYSHRASVPTNAWWHLLLQAHQHIDLLAYAMLFLPEQHPDLIKLLKEKSESACKIRIALANPTCANVQLRDEEEKLGGTLPDRIRTTMYHLREIVDYPGIEVKYHTAILYNSIFRCDNEMFLTTHLHGLHGSKAPLLHLHYLEQDGVFANYLSHFEAVWATTTPVGTVPLEK